MNVLRVLGQFQLIRFRKTLELDRAAVKSDVRRTKKLGFGNRLLGPGTGVDVIRSAALQEVHRDLGELGRGAALQEQDMELVVEAADPLDPLDGFVVDRIVFLATVGPLHQVHPGATVVEP